MKRVIGIPGDVIEISDGQVFVNGELSPFDDEFTSSYSEDYPLTVPPNKYFVLGDNRSVSSDSRQWGVVDARKIVGRAWFTYWPTDAIHLFR